MARQPNSTESVSERRKYVRATLVGSALVSPQSGAKGFTAVLNNVNKIGAKITVSLAFLDPDRVEQQEKLSATVAWAKPWEKGMLLGVVWDDLVTKEKNRWLYYYLEETLKSTN